MEKHSTGGKCRKQFTSCHYMDTLLHSHHERECHHWNAATLIKWPSQPSLHYAQRCSEIEPKLRSSSSQSPQGSVLVLPQTTSEILSVINTARCSVSGNDETYLRATGWITVWGDHGFIPLALQACANMTQKAERKTLLWCFCSTLLYTLALLMRRSWLKMQGTPLPNVWKMLALVTLSESDIKGNVFVKSCLPYQQPP